MQVVWIFYSHLSFLSSFSLSLGDGLIWTEILSQSAVKPKTTYLPTSWWKTLKFVIKPDQASSIPALNREGVIYCNDNDKANILNQYFIEQTIIEEENATLHTTLPLPARKFDSITVTLDDVESTLKTLQLGKAARPDAINNRILKELADSLSLSLSDFFNYSLSTGKLPSVWKLANDTPIHKKMTLQMYLITDLSLFEVLSVKY